MEEGRRRLSARFKAKDGAYLRKEFFGKQYPELLKLTVEHLSDDELFHLSRRTRCAQAACNAYKRAAGLRGGPTRPVLAKTVKGYGLGSAQARAMRRCSYRKFPRRSTPRVSIERFKIPIPVEAAKNADFYRPDVTAILRLQ